MPEAFLPQGGLPFRRGIIFHGFLIFLRSGESSFLGGRESAARSYSKTIVRNDFAQLIDTV